MLLYIFYAALVGVAMDRMMHVWTQGDYTYV